MCHNSSVVCHNAYVSALRTDVISVNANSFQELFVYLAAVVMQENAAKKGFTYNVNLE